MSTPEGQLTLLLTELREGKQEAAGQLMPLVYSELRRMASSYMQRERSGRTLRATALVNVVYMRLAWGKARSHIAEKRGGKDAQKVDIDAEWLRGVSPKIVIAIDDALNRLERMDPRESRLIELRFFAGISVEEAAEVMGVSSTTIKREWRMAKAWLHRELAGERPA